jgi:hypothetical protein
MQSEINHDSPSGEVSDEELLKVIADFLEMGHVENIVAMFADDPRYYDWTGQLLTDERFAVRLGVSVLFEYLVEEQPDQVHLAVPSLAKALQNPVNWVRGEALGVLAIIGSSEARAAIRPIVKDPDPRIADLAREIMNEEEA